MLDDDYAVGEFRLQLHGCRAERRFVVIREQVCEDCDGVSRKLIEAPVSPFRVFVALLTSATCARIVFSPLCRDDR